MYALTVYVNLPDDHPWAEKPPNKLVLTDGKAWPVRSEVAVSLNAPLSDPRDGRYYG